MSPTPVLKVCIRVIRCALDDDARVPHSSRSRIAAATGSSHWSRPVVPRQRRSVDPIWIGGVTVTT